MAAFLTAHWVPIVIGIAAVLFGFNHKDKLIDIGKRVTGMKTKVSEDIEDGGLIDLKAGGLSRLVDAIANLKVIKDLGIVRSDIVRTILLASVLRLRNYVETVDESLKEEGLEACQTLGKILISGGAPDVDPADPVPIQDRRSVI